MNDQLTTQNNPFALSTMDEAEKMAGWIASSGCFGITKKEQALTLMLLAREEGTTLSAMLRKVHVFDTGKLSQRADYTQSLFEKTGTILWHVRTPEMVAGSFFKIRPIDEAMRKRAMERFELQWRLDAISNQPERSADKEGEMILKLSRLAFDGEVTIIRTMLEAEQMGVAGKANYKLGGMNMLQWRCVTDGVKLIDPAVLSGLASDVELSDLKTYEQASLTTRAAPNSHDLEAMQAILDHHLENARAATTDAERSRILGLASDMRVKIQEGWDKQKPAKVDFTEQNRATIDGAIKRATARHSVPAEADATDKPKTIDQLAGKPDGSFKAHIETEQAQMVKDEVERKKNVIEAKVDQVEPPKKDKKKSEAAPPEVSSPKSDAKPEPGPFGEQQTEEQRAAAVDLANWREYRVHLTTSKQFHKKLSEFSRPEIDILYKKRSLPFLHAPDEALKLEALMIQQAHDGGAAK